MKLLLLLATGLSVFGVFIAQIVALTSAPFNKRALCLRVTALLIWFTSLLLANGKLLDDSHCYVDCALGMNRESLILELFVIAFSWAVAWFSGKAVPLVATSR